MIGTHRTVIGQNARTGRRFVQYHATRVVEWDEYEIELNTGGYRTATTKLRMNQTSDQYGLGFRVFQKDFRWFAEFRGNTVIFYGETLTLVR